MSLCRLYTSFCYVLLTSATLVGAHAQPQSPSTHSRLCWQEGIRLKWEDFQAPQHPSADGHDPAKLSALTAVVMPLTEITDSNGAPTYRLDCVFLRDLSWVNSQVKSAEDRASTLAHEQIHFDLAELIVRKVRRRIADGIRAGEDIFSSEVNADIQCLLTEYNPLNDLYDDDVNFRAPAVEAAAQRRWTLQVASELRALSPYRSTAATCLD
ncbi:hypothetical protein [Hymenobacter terrenus]|uniref:hypothetical protein n=1 Tax=Hymenobacter terrenus TaxID=1629124 RepID=UPI000A8AF001|nr:hypothetical protein [Hymenobacter terrenus]